MFSKLPFLYVREVFLRAIYTETRSAQQWRAASRRAPSTLGGHPLPGRCPWKPSRPSAWGSRLARRQTPTHGARCIAMQRLCLALPAAGRPRAASLASALAFRPGVGAGPTMGPTAGPAYRSSRRVGSWAWRGGAGLSGSVPCVCGTVSPSSKLARGMPVQGPKPSHPERVGPTVRRSGPVRSQGWPRIDAPLACAPPPL